MDTKSSNGQSINQEIRLRDEEIQTLKDKIRHLESVQVFGQDFYVLQHKLNEIDLRFTDIEQILRIFVNSLSQVNSKDQAPICHILNLIRREFKSHKPILKILNWIGNLIKWVESMSSFEDESLDFKSKAVIATKRLYILCYRLFREVSLAKDISEFLILQEYVHLYGKSDNSKSLTIDDLFWFCNNCTILESKRKSEIPTTKIHAECQTDFESIEIGMLPTLNELRLKQLSVVIQELHSKYTVS